MTPAEVIAMRDKLATGLYEETGKRTRKQFLHAMSLADWLIESGWVTSEPRDSPTQPRETGPEYGYVCGKGDIDG